MKQFYFKMIKIPRLAPFLGILFLLVSQGMQAATITSNAVTGNWSDTATWVGGVVPTATDDVVISNGATVTITIGVTMNPGTTVTVATGGLLKTTSSTIVSIFDTLIVNGTYSNISTVTVRLLLDGSGNFDNSIATSSTLYLSGPTTNVTTLTIGSTSNTVIYNGGNQTIKTPTPSSTYRKLITSGTGTKTWTLAASSTVQGLTINSGAPLNISGNYSFTIGTTGSTISDALTFDSAYNTNRNIYSLTINPTGSLIDLNTTGGTITTAQANPITNYGTINTGTIAFKSGYAIANYGVVTCKAITLGTPASDTGTFNNYGTLNFNGNNTTIPTTATALTQLTLTNYTGSTVNYGYAGNQPIKDVAYSNLTLSNSGTKLIGTAASGTLCSGTLRIEGAAKANVTNNVNVSKLILGGVGQLTGYYGLSNSGGSTYFATGTGIITVSTNTNSWTGATDNLWSKPTNWSMGVVPTSTDGIAIASGSPVLDTNFTLPSGGSLLLFGSGALTVAPAATLTVAGAADFGGRPITFKSDASGTARFGILTGTLNGATNVTVERFIPAKRAFRLLSSPVTTTTSINANWQEGGTNNTGLGTHITGTGGASNGFDPSATNNPSLFTHDNAAQAWSAVTNTATTVLTAGTPYRIMVRGDRSLDIINDPNPSPNATTLRATGILKTGIVTLSGLSTAVGGFSLIGNPYQSPVDMAATLSSATNLKNFYFVWDPNLGTRGAYVTRDLLASTNNITSNVDNYLQPGQACFVQTNLAAAATLSFTEANKYTTATNQNVFRPASPAATQATPSASIRLTLYNKTALANQGTPSDGAVVLFNATSANEVDANDCSKMTNLDENLAFNTNGNLLSIEHRAVPTAADEIQLAITQYRAKEYTLVAESSTIDGLTPYLVDQYTKTATAIPAAGSINYNFTVDPSNANSSAANRFKIIFQDTTSVTEFTENEVKVYPNPSTGGMVSISLPFIQQESKVSVLNFAGETIYSTTIAAGDNAAINPDKSLALGIYFVKIEQAGKTVTKKLIIK